MATIQENQPHAGLEKQDLITHAGHHDVLLGRGGGTNNHVGNKNFRQLVNENKRRYIESSKVEKPKIARDVVEIWQNLDPPGRFLQKISGGSKSKESTVYEEVSLKKAREKASQCLRERTSDVAPYLNKYHKDQDKMTEEGVEKVKEKMTNETTTPTKKTEASVPDESTSAATQTETAQAQEKIVQAAQAAQSHQSELGLQQLYARQQENLQKAYIADNQRLQQTAMQQNTRQQAAMRGNSLQQNAMRRNSLQQNAMQQNAMQQNVMRHNSLQQNAMQQNAMQQNVMRQNSMQQNAMHMARQQAFHEQKVIEHQTKLLLQQQMAMQEQMLKNNIMAQQLMMQRSGYAVAAAQQTAARQAQQGVPLPPPGTPEAARRMSLNTGFSQMALNNAVSPAHLVPQNSPAMQHHVPPSSPAIHNSPAIHSSPAMHGSPHVRGQMMAHKMASIPVQPNLTQQNMAPQHQPSTSFSSPREANNHLPIPLGSNHNEVDNHAILEYTAHLEKEQQEQENSQTDEKQQSTPPTQSKKKSPSKSKIPIIIATSSSDNLDATTPTEVSSSDVTKEDKNLLTDRVHHLDDSTKLSHFSDYDEALNDYHTGLNDTGSHVFTDESSEEMLKDHSALRDHSSIRDDLHSTGSCEISLPRKKGGLLSRRNSKSSSMSMSIGSLSGMDYSADELHDHKMHSSRSFGSNRSLMSELTDYHDLTL